MKAAFLAILAASALSGLSANAALVYITASDLPGCDVLSVPTAPIADELGDPGGFPAGEWVSHSVAIGEWTVCDDMPSNPSITDRMIQITNLQSYDVGGLYYVINGSPTPGSFSNADGLINGSLAMAIDSIGKNRPLLFESSIPDGLFQAGETWRFVVQDYVSGVNADFFFTQALVGSGDPLPSLVVPEPSGLALLSLGGLALLRRRRR